MDLQRDRADILPPMPPPREGLPGPAELLRLLRTDLLALVPRRAYQGQVLRLPLLGRTVTLVNTPELVHDIFVLRQDIYGRKSPVMERALAPVVGGSLFIGHGADWAARRAALAPALHPSRLSAFHPHIVQAAEELAAEWDRAAGGPPRDIAADLAAATARTVMLATFGATAPREAAAALAGAFATYQEALEGIDIALRLGLPDWVPSFQGRAARAAARQLRSLVTGLVRATPPGAGLLAPLAAARRPDGTKLLDEAGLVDEAAMLLLAGSETAATALAWALLLSTGDPAALARLRAEAAFLRGAAPGAGDLAALPFARAVTQEALRLYPPVAMLLRQAARPDRIRRWDIPRGATVGCVPWLLHRHEAVWEDPHRFRPERFLPGAPKPPRFAWIPYGLGPRVCAGAALGGAEMLVFLTLLLGRFDLTVPPGERPMPRLRLTLRPAQGLRMRIARRA